MTIIALYCMLYPESEKNQLTSVVPEEFEVAAADMPGKLP
jgi:hypothetical protein